MGGRIVHVHQEMMVENPNPLNFYRGDSATWAPISNDFDFGRAVTTQMLANLKVSGNDPKFVLLKGTLAQEKCSSQANCLGVIWPII